MPHLHVLLPEHHVGITRFTGRLEGTEVSQAVLEMYAADAWQPGFSAVWDSRGVKSLELEFRDYRAIVDLHQQVRERIVSGRIACVVNRAVLESAANVFLAMLKQGNIRAFTTWNEALEWVLPDLSVRLEIEQALAALELQSE